MTIFKKTILGKILCGAGKVIGVAAGAAAVIGTGGAALGAIAAGGGVLSKILTGAKAVLKVPLTGIAKVGGAIGKTVGAVAKSAVNLVTGTTKDERDQVQEVKAEAKAAQDKLDQVERLVKAGATRAKAMEMAGVTAYELGSANAEQKDTEAETRLLAEETPLKTAGVGCLIPLLLFITSFAAMVFIFIIL